MSTPPDTPRKRSRESQPAPVERMPSLPSPSFKKPRLTPSPRKTGSVSSSTPPDTVPTAALLYHTALQAHDLAHYHLSQAFVPSTVGPPADKQPFKRATWRGRVPFSHDPHAAGTAMRLLIMALDLLRSGLALPGLSDRESVAFGAEFARIAVKVLAGEKALKGLRSAERNNVGIQVRTEELVLDLEDVLAKSLAIAQKSRPLQGYRYNLEYASAQLAFLRNKGSFGKRIVKQALQATPLSQPAHRYNMILLQLDYLYNEHAGDFLVAVDQLQREAQEQNHGDMVQLAHIIRLAGVFELRRWDGLVDAVARAAEVIDVDLPDGSPFSFAVLIHFLNYATLACGRTGDDAAARKYSKKLADLIDGLETSDELRSNGGVLKILLPIPSGETQHIYVQTTPSNALCGGSYVTTIVARRQLNGPLRNCRTLTHARAMFEHEATATPGDLWDSGFSSCHGVADALALRNTMYNMLADAKMEEALALIYRSSFEQAHHRLAELARFFRDAKLLTSLGPQLALLYAQFAHLLGQEEVAVRYYRSAQSMIVPGSELRLYVDIGLMAAQGHLEDLHTNPEHALQANILADTCLCVSNSALQGVGHFLSSLADLQPLHAKRKMSRAHPLCKPGALHALIFAFTTTSHNYGDWDRQLRQLEAGAALAGLLGGSDRKDGVGQVWLGLWYHVKLRDHYRLSGREEDEAAEQAKIDLHQKRLNEIRAYGQRIFRRS